MPQPEHQRANAWRRWLARRGGLASRFVLLLSLWSPWLQADDAPTLEYKVKGAFLVKFGSFVEWPAPKTDAAPTNEFLIGILGADPFGNELDEAVKSEHVKGRAVRLVRAAEPGQLTDCQVIFIPRSETVRWPEILSALAAKPILTVGETPGFAARGGMVNFYKEDGKVRFELNAAAAGRAGLKLSAKLLQVGKPVEEGKPS